MPDPPEIGKTNWNGALREGRRVLKIARRQLDRLMHSDSSSNTVKVIANLAILIGEFQDILTELQDIGDAERGERERLQNKINAIKQELQALQEKNHDAQVRP